jgi:hypothetical protein
MTETAAKKAIKAHLMLKTEVKKGCPTPHQMNCQAASVPGKKVPCFRYADADAMDIVK